MLINLYCITSASVCAGGGGGITGTDDVDDDNDDNVVGCPNPRDSNSTLSKRALSDATASQARASADATARFSSASAWRFTS